LVDQRLDSDGTSTAYVQDGAISANEYGAGNSQSFLGAGTGFGGTVGNGALYMDFDSTNLYLGFQAGNNLNDNVVILIDSRAGGFTDAMMSDTGDPGRNLSSNLTRDVDDIFFPTFLPDFSIVIGQFGIVAFELTAGTLNFLKYDGQFTGNNPGVAREFFLDRATMGLSAPNASFDYIVGYGSDSNFMSNEGIPGQGFAGGANPGWDNNGAGPVHWERYNQMGIVPEPGTMLALALGLGALAARRRSR
jgi:hypothetical protein